MFQRTRSWLIDYINNENQRVWQSSEIDATKYPKALAFIQTLVQRYPKHLTGMKLYLSNYPDMKATATEIYIGKFWLDELEKENVRMQNLVEWTILHEAYHVKKHHMQNYMTLYFGSYAVVACVTLYFAIFSASGWLYSESLPKQFLLMFALAFLALRIPHLVRIAYSRFIMEPQADSFANVTCKNIDALDRAKVFIAHSPEDALHPSRASRIAKIDKAMQKLQNK